jgi:hypothetical protein
LWLTPLAGLLPVSDDARLPVCCRRHGAHHCAMGGDSSQSAPPGSDPSIQAPSRCPQFPTAVPATTAPAFALAVRPTAFPDRRIVKFTPAPLEAAPRLSYLHAHSDRGPPAPDLA